MTKSNRLKKLANIRLVLSAIAVLLAVSMVFSGVKHFGHKPPTEEPETIPTVITETGETEPGYTDYFPGPVAEEDDKQRDSGPGYDGKEPGPSTGGQPGEKPGDKNDTEDTKTESGSGGGLGGIGNDHGVPDNPAERPDNNSSNNGSSGGGSSDSGSSDSGSSDSGSSDSGSSDSGSSDSGSSDSGSSDSGSSDSGSSDSSSSDSGSSDSGSSDSGSSDSGSSSSSSDDKTITLPNGTTITIPSNPSGGGWPLYGGSSVETDSRTAGIDPANLSHSKTDSAVSISFLSGDLSGIPIDPAAGTTGETENTAPTGTSVQTETEFQTEAIVQTETEIQTEAVIQTETESQTETTSTESTDPGTDPGPGPGEKDSNIWGILFWSSAALLALDLLAIVAVSREIEVELKRQRRMRSRAAVDADRLAEEDHASAPVQKMSTTQRITPVLKVGTVHQKGRREHQQDSLAHTAVLNNTGIIAVVADGMGGLSGGEMVSQKIVMDTLAMARQLRPGQTNGVLYQMLDAINENVNRLLGPEGLYKSGSTMVAILAHEGKFQWISVGDSRIYLYRQGYANQLNHDHDQLQVWMADVLSGRRNLEETLRNPDGRKLTSFIGMGQLKYIDGSRCPIPLEAGDRLVLMSDGIYNMLSEDALADILKRYPDVEQAAAVIDRVIREGNHPHQDNYTAIILGF